MTEAIVKIEKLSHSYGERLALNDVSLSIPSGQIFGLLGPNGGGKTTLFRILCTLFPVTKGEVSVLGLSLRRDIQKIREQIGVVFQAPSLDKKLTVIENLRHQGHLYGLSGSSLEQRIAEMLDRVKLKDRSKELVEKLSGGLQRRVEVAKALLHQPKILLLDEPSTGLDPGARKDLWDYLQQLRSQQGTTILLTTHLMDESEKCDQLGILDKGKLIALDTPDALRARIGGEMIMAQSKDPEGLCGDIRKMFGGDPIVVDQTVRFEKAKGHEFVAKLIEAFPGRIDSVTVGRPTLEDVFIKLTGHQFWTDHQDGKKGAA
jgi:ABC-2 type transport system ATP-binding protein